MKKFYCISGMPRSGSTLLCNILAQNPKIHATHTSGCLDVLFGVRNHWHTLIEHKAHPNDNCLKRILKGIIENYYSDITKPIIFDKSRGWNQYLNLLENILDSKAKVLVPIRFFPDILASMEQLHRETSKIKEPPGEKQNYFAMQTIEGRCETWTRGDNVVGLAYNRIKDALQCGFSDRMFFVHYEKLTSDPESMMKSIYSFIGEEYYPHDFNNVQQITTENDEIYGYINLHKICSKIEPNRSKSMEILGEKLTNMYRNVTYS